MAEEKITGNHLSLSNTDLAFERTALAYERTLMAWVRTATSMISFGFTIYKFFNELKGEEASRRIFTPRIVGMIMILFGLLSLVLAQAQHNMAIKKLRRDYPHAQKSISSILSFLILVFGLALFLGALFRQ
jgi:putative membrane protein